MNESTNQYLLLFRGTDWHNGLSPEQIQTIMTQWKGWFDRLTASGKARAGQPLLPEGKVVSGKNGRTLADGPFAESKEAIGGYFLLAVDSMDEAVAIARECPALAHGLSVEVRPVAHQCPAAELAKQMGMGEPAGARA